MTALLLQGSGVVMPKKHVSAWEAAYRAYRDASDAVARSRGGNPDLAREMAAASWSVAHTWRALAGNHDQPWWVIAAVGSAAQAFEEQAREWERRAGGDWHVGRTRTDLGDRALGRGDGGGDWFESPLSAGAGDVRDGGGADDQAAGQSGQLAGPGQIPPPAPRLRGRTGSAARYPRGERGL